MDGLVGLMPAATACAGLAAACSALLTGWEREDRQQAMRAWRARGAVLAATAMRMAHGAERRVRACGTPADAVGLREVSEMIDIVRLGLSAGLSFDAALGLYCEGRDGALAARLARAKLLWQTGAGAREDELMLAARDLGVRPLESFSVAVGQALLLGAPLAETLAGQSTEIRAAHRAEVERQIERAPVKLLIPTGTLILPALLLSILGPLLAAGGML